MQLERKKTRNFMRVVRKEEEEEKGRKKEKRGETEAKDVNSYEAVTRVGKTGH
jgi:hypothetical protein